MPTATTVPVKMAQRRDTAANWTSANPTLLAGEIGIESDTSKIKLGTGSTAWTSLSYTPWSQVSTYPFVNADIASGAAIAGSKIVAATTSVVGAVQLSDSISTTSSVLAATPTAVKAAYDLAAAALPKAGGTLTGNVILDNQVDARFREATANGTNYVGFQAPATIAADVLWTLPATDGAAGQALVTNGSAVLAWAAAGGSSVIVESQQVIGADYTLTAGYNGMSAGPVEVAATFAVTVPASATWVIL